MKRNERIIGRLLSGHGRVLALAGLVGAVGVNGAVRLADRVEDPRRPAPVVEVAAGAEEAGSTRASARAATAEWDLPNLDHPRVEYWVERFSTDPGMREKFEGFLQRSGWYRDMISAKLAERDMPQDLFYLAMIESGFQPHAYSPAAASGLWQFISATGKRYGLHIDGWVDERNHPEKATDAALDYLEDLHDRFDSWYLAAAAYNTGEGRVGRIMRQEFGTEKAFGEGAYYRIWDRLPRETRDYVPLMIAAARIAKDLEAYGFDHVRPEPALEYVEVVTDAGLTLDQVAEAAGVDVQTVKLMNAHFRKGRTPSDRRVAVRLPVGTRDEFERGWPEFVDAHRFARSVSGRPAQPATYRVRRGDNLTGIARRHGTTVSQLRRMNGLRSDRIYAGQVLSVSN